jgi:hypothetical protein
MGLQNLIHWVGPLLYLAGILYFLLVSDRAQRKPMLLAWVLPGLGHWSIGRRDRGLFFGIQLITIFLVGLWLSDFRCVSPFDRHPLWGLTQIPGGGLTLVTALATSTLKLSGDNAYYQAGCLYVGVACLLNLVALCDLTEPESRRAARRVKTP